MRKNCLEYPVEIVEDAFGASPALAKCLRDVTGSETPNVLIVADENVVRRQEGLGRRLGAYMQTHGLKLAGAPVLLSGGEWVKCEDYASVTRVIKSALEAKLGSDGCVLALGGGCVLDVASYVAAQVRGGVKVVRMPTSPAAMLCGAFAAYGAINSPNVKDALRVPSVPAAVIIDPTLASTVLDGVWNAGFAEAVRLALSLDAALLKKLVARVDAYRAHDTKAFGEILADCVALRQKKGGSTLGEWFAARLEPMSAYKLPHGYGIVLGLCVDMTYAVETGMMKPEQRASVMELIDKSWALDSVAHSLGLFTQVESVMCGLDAWRLSTGGSSLAMPAGLGKSVVCDAPDREVMAHAITATRAELIALVNAKREEAAKAEENKTEETK